MIPVPHQAEQTGHWTFQEELMLPEHLSVKWERKRPYAGEADLSRGFVIVSEFPDPEGLLDTAVNDLRLFQQDAGLSASGSYRILLCRTETECREAYILEAGLDCCRIAADDTEGIRRGIYEIRDLLTASDGAFLKLCTLRRKPWIKTRISRCFFGPTNRPPQMIDELANEVDYYPDAYLSRLAAEGVNGLWLTIEFKDICRSLLFPGTNAEKRLEKLRKTVLKCRRYGIRIYLFSIEPDGLSSNSELLKKYPEIDGGDTGFGVHYFCPSSEMAQKHLYDCTNFLFHSVPHLGGLINISFGERFTSCVNQMHPNLGGRISCPRCQGLQPWEILNHVLEPMERGMHDANPEAELLDWLYMPEETPEIAEWTLKLAEHHPGKTVMLYNFESGIEIVQEGKMRCGGDYWHSQTGPGEPFRKMALVAQSVHVRTGAKIQVACSHETATVPEVPVPGLMYDKYKAMRELGVTHIMQCWYFGNYPGLMSRTAGELSFHEFHTSKEEFLYGIARRDWHDHAEEAVRAWLAFESAYGNYPLSKLFQYYGPMHDGIIWPLYPLYAGIPLAPTWIQWMPSGDAIGECLHKFTLEDADSLTSRLAEGWNDGIKILNGLRDVFREDGAQIQHIELAEAIGLLFSAGYDILHFYRLREKYFLHHDLSARKEMHSIIQRQISASKRMKELCSHDPRLGYHSEAEGFKFYPGLLDWRVKQLESVLDTDNQEFIPEKIECGQWQAERTFRYRISKNASLLTVDFECLDTSFSLGADTDEISVMVCNARCTVFPRVFDFTRRGRLSQNCPGKIFFKILETKPGWIGHLEIPVPEECSFHIQRQNFAEGKIHFDAWTKPAEYRQFERGFFHPHCMRTVVDAGAGQKN